MVSLHNVSTMGHRGVEKSQLPPWEYYLPAATVSETSAADEVVHGQGITTGVGTSEECGTDLLREWRSKAPSSFRYIVVRTLHT